MKLAIPPISDERIAELSARIRPVYRTQRGELRWMKPCNPRTQSFLWDPQDDGPAEGLEMCAAAPTLHTFGYAGFFKPSIAEVFAQLPDFFIEGAIAFETVGPHDADDLNHAREALNAGFHVATTTLYRASHGPSNL